MSFLFSADYYEVRKNGISPAQNMAAYLGGSAIQTVGDNPVTAYRQLVQQFAKGLDGSAVDPKVAASEANAIFLKAPLQASLSGLWPRLIGVLFKRIPKFGILLGYGVVTGDTSGKPGFAAATCASILSAPFINPVRMVEKQQRAFFKQTGAEKPLMEIMRESAAKVPPPPTPTAYHPPHITRRVHLQRAFFSRPPFSRPPPTPPTPTLCCAELCASLPWHNPSDGPLHGERHPRAGRSAEVAEIRPGVDRHHWYAGPERVRSLPWSSPRPVRPPSLHTFRSRRASLQKRPSLQRCVLARPPPPPPRPSPWLSA